MLVPEIGDGHRGGTGKDGEFVLSLRPKKFSGQLCKYTGDGEG